jgi:hypothetical protein
MRFETFIICFVCFAMALPPREAAPHTRLTPFEHCDPDTDKFAEMMECAIRVLPDSHPSHGLFRVFRHRARHRHRLVTRGAVCLSFVVNRNMLPHVMQTSSGRRRSTQQPTALSTVAGSLLTSPLRTSLSLKVQNCALSFRIGVVFS